MVLRLKLKSVLNYAGSARYFIHLFRCANLCMGNLSKVRLEELGKSKMLLGNVLQALTETAFMRYKDLHRICQVVFNESRIQTTSSNVVRQLPFEIRIGTRCVANGLASSTPPTYIIESTVYLAHRTFRNWTDQSELQKESQWCTR